MFAPTNQPQAQPSAAPQGATPNLANGPDANSAFGGKPVGLTGSTDPRQVLAKAELLLHSGAISYTQYQMIVAKLMGAGHEQQSPQQALAPQQPVTTTGIPGGGPSAAWGA